MHMLVPSCALHATLHPLCPLIPTNASLYLLVHSHALYTYSWTYLIISSLYIIVNISWSILMDFLPPSEHALFLQDDQNKG